MRSFPFTAKCLLAIGCCLQPTALVAQKTCDQPELATDPKFAPGQIWAYKTRPNEPTSTITILRIEKTPKLGTIIHIRIDGVHFSDCKGNPATNGMEHAPFKREALDGSVTTKLGEASTLPNFSAGYQDWRSHCGGIYTIPIDKVVETDDFQYKKLLGCS